MRHKKQGNLKTQVNPRIMNFCCYVGNFIIWVKRFNCCFHVCLISRCSNSVKFNYSLDGASPARPGTRVNTPRLFVWHWNATPSVSGARFGWRKDTRFHTKDTWWFYYSKKSSSVKASPGDNFLAKKKEFTNVNLFWS